MAVDQTTYVTNIATVLSGDVSLAEGTHAIVWDMGAQGLSLQASNVVFHVLCEADASLLDYIDWRIGSGSITNGGAMAYADATAVHYAADEDRTDAQKAQARANIGAADDETVAEHGRLLTQVVSNVYGDVAIRQNSWVASYLWYLRANDPITERGTITNVSMDYDKKPGQSTYGLKLGVFSFDHSTPSATVKALYDLDTESRIIDTNIPVEAGDVIGFWSENRLVLGKGATTNQWNRFLDTHYINGRTISVGSTYPAADYKNSISVRYSVKSDYDYDFSKTEYGDLNVVLMGDSIVAHAGWTCDGIQNQELGNVGGWGKWFKRSAKPKSIYNYAVGGARWAHTSRTTYDLRDDYTLLGTTNNVIYNQINRLIYNVDNHGYPVPDLIIISCGVNDSSAIIETDEAVDAVFASYVDANWNVPECTPWTCDLTKYPKQDVTSYNTISKAMKFDMELILQKFPDVQVVFLSQQPTVSRASSPTYARDASAKTHVVARVAGLYYAAPVIDVERECGICRMQEVHTHKYLIDGVHLTISGAKRIGKFLANRIRTYLPVKDFGIGH